MLGRLVMRGCGIPASTREQAVGDVGAMLVEDPRVGLWFRAHAIPVQAQTLGHYVSRAVQSRTTRSSTNSNTSASGSGTGRYSCHSNFGSSAAALFRGRRPYWDNRFEAAARRRADRDGVAAWELAAGTSEDETRPRT